MNFSLSSTNNSGGYIYRYFLWSFWWQTFHLSLTYNCHLPLLFIPHPGSMACSSLRWSGQCKITGKCISRAAIHFCGIAKTSVIELQCVQNWVVREVTKSPPSTHSVALLGFLHRLTVKFGLGSISVCWPKQLIVKDSLIILTQCLPHYSHTIHWDQAKESLCRSLLSGPTQV